MIVGLTSGCFDLIHHGHLVYLQRCRDLCDKLIVGVDCDGLVWGNKGAGRPVIPQEERMALVSSLSCVDLVFLLEDIEELESVAKKFRVSKVFKHEGFAQLDCVWGVTEKAELVIVPDVPGLVSTSEIIRRIKARKL